jgi:hypothetical protein
LSLGFNKVEVEGLTIKTKRFGVKQVHSIEKIYGKLLFLVLYITNDATIYVASFFV